MQLSCGDLSARVELRGAQLRSLRRGSEEYLWQDEAGVWPQSAPILFPFVGRLRGGGYTHAGRSYRQPIHGFASAQEFELVEQRDDALRLRLRANAATRAIYPFDFRLDVDFELSPDALQLRYSVVNESREAMAFGLGSHPAFALPAAPLGDWSVEFETDEAPEVYRLDGELLAAMPEPLVFSPPRSVQLGEQLFDRDALIFKNIRSRRLSLNHRAHGERLRIHTGGAPHLGLWARPRAAYVCIEPWWGVDEHAQSPQELLHKPDLLRLAPAQRFETGYRIELAARRD
ncbi:aldose 1-epimerase family protein [Roseateles violae]|uniref:Aldose 1-epimerase family protein n=1 Tax=Roseateles violae TaxID=3058042 RepID=A0ABT8DPR5_9BURK|nr:aldose 1-epimerase family protein [Pelomonas sp. PFR6]MDN3920335.1 aldose 1-epimerase family protein [Pelomonas sp. PFR6]